MKPKDAHSLYPAHLSTIKTRVDRALERGGFDHLLVPAGVEKYEFLDDRPYPFKPSAQFKAWLPLTRHPHCWIAYTPGRKPVLAYYQPDDYWHVPPTAPEGAWVDAFDVRVISDPAEAAQHLPAGGRAAILGEADAALPGFVVAKRSELTRLGAGLRHPRDELRHCAGRRRPPRATERSPARRGFATRRVSRVRYGAPRLIRSASS